MLKISFSILSLVILTNGHFFGDGFKTIMKSAHDYSVQGGVFVKTIDQPVDHFNSRDNRTWIMRYLGNMDYYKSGGPIYIFIGGVSDFLNPGIISRGLMRILAADANAALFCSEHRYYGPKGVIPLDPYKTVNNFKYLSSKQALADLAVLVQTLKDFLIGSNPKVVVVGGSYSGNLAVWARLLYPHLIDAAIASSAPVQATKDFHEYLEKVSSDLQKYGTPGCHDRIAEIFKQYDQLIQTPDGIAQLKKQFHICDFVDLTLPKNKEIFFFFQTYPYMRHVQFGYPSDIQKMCKENFEIKHHLIWDHEKQCKNYDFDSLIKVLQTDRKFNALYSWLYQICTEFGYFITGNSDNQPFTKNVKLDLFVEACSKLYGTTEDSIDKGIAATNARYGGKTPNVSKVIFVNGEMDPWSTLGIETSLSPDAPAIVIQNASHISDIVNPTANPKVMHYVIDTIKKWIS